MFEFRHLNSSYWRVASGLVLGLLMDLRYLIDTLKINVSFIGYGKIKSLEKLAYVALKHIMSKLSHKSLCLACGTCFRFTLCSVRICFKCCNFNFL
jgi:hypothetical protein